MLNLARVAANARLFLCRPTAAATPSLCSSSVQHLAFSTGKIDGSKPKGKPKQKNNSGKNRGKTQNNGNKSRGQRNSGNQSKERGDQRGKPGRREPNVPFQPTGNAADGTWVPPTMQKGNIPDILMKGGPRKPGAVIPTLQRKIYAEHQKNPEENTVERLAEKYKIRRNRVAAILKLWDIRSTQPELIVGDESIDSFLDKFLISPGDTIVNEEMWDSSISLEDYAESLSSRNEDLIEQYYDSMVEKERPPHLKSMGVEFQALDEFENEEAAKAPVLKRLKSILKENEQHDEAVTRTEKKDGWNLEYIKLNSKK